MSDISSKKSATSDVVLGAAICLILILAFGGISLASSTKKTKLEETPKMT